MIIFSGNLFFGNERKLHEISNDISFAESTPWISSNEKRRWYHHRCSMSCLFLLRIWSSFSFILSGFFLTSYFVILNVLLLMFFQYFCSHIEMYVYNAEKYDSCCIKKIKMSEVWVEQKHFFCHGSALLEILHKQAISCEHFVRRIDHLLAIVSPSLSNISSIIATRWSSPGMGLLRDRSKSRNIFLRLFNSSRLFNTRAC